MVMSILDNHTVGLRDLRHHTSKVLARVRHGETIDVTQYGKPIARIIPVEDRTPSPVLERLIESGRACAPVTAPNRLGDALTALRDEESW